MLRELADRPDLSRDLLHDLVVVDDIVLELRTRGQIEEDVVSTVRRDLGLRTCGQQRVEDVVDLDLDVVLLAPFRPPRLVEPDVEGRDEVGPGDQR